MSVIKKIAKKVLPYRIRDWMSFANSQLRPYKPLVFEPGLNGGGVTANVIVHGLRTFKRHNLSVFDKVISDLLKNNGAQVKMLICDNVLDSCDIYAKGEGVQADICHKCREERSDFKKFYKNDFLSYAQFITSEEKSALRNEIASLTVEEIRSFHYLGVNVAAHAIDSTQRYFKAGNLDFNNKETVDYLRHAVLQGAICVKVADGILKKEKPTHFVTLHGVYVSWAPMADYFKHNGVKVLVYFKSVERVGGFSFVKGGFDNRSYDRDAWAVFKNQALSLEKKQQLEDFMTDLRNKKTHAYQLYCQAHQEKPEHQWLEDKFNDKSKKKFVMYTNLLWDRGLESAGSDVFRDVIEWMTATINHFKGKTTHTLFIKPHPGELSIDRTPEGIKHTLLKIIGKMPDNIFFIPGEYPTTSFDLMGKDIIGITYNGSVGMESSYFKKPVLVAGNIHYVSAGIVPSIKSKEAYFRLIDEPGPLYQFPLNNWDIIEKYCYFYYFINIMDIEFFRKDVFRGHCINWEVLNSYDEFIKTNKSLNDLGRSIVEWKPFVRC